MSNDRVLIVAAHPDDEVLGCGGTIARHVRRGDHVDVVILCDGESSRLEPGSTREREKCAKDAAKILGANIHSFLGMPDNRLDQVPLLNIVKPIENIIGELNPSIVYTHHGGDLNIDHQIANRAALTACRPLPDSNVRAIFTFEILSSTEWGPAPQASTFIAQYGIDVSNTISVKMEALRCYDREMRRFPHPRSYEMVTAQATMRGGQFGMMAAEAFGIARQIWRI